MNSHRDNMPLEREQFYVALLFSISEIFSM